MLVKEPHVQPPPLDNYSDTPIYNTKAVVHRTGVPAPTLRAWERRYGILSPRRGENDYRLYSERDMAIIAWLRERVESGMTISQAIALLRSLDQGRRRGRRKQSSAPIAEPTAPTAVGAVVPATFALDELVASLRHHCLRLDETAANLISTEALAIYPLEQVCLGLYQPVLAQIGTLWAEGQVGVTIEHFASALIRAQLESLFRCVVSNEHGPLVFVGCASGELHEIGPLMLALFMRRAGMHVLYLGQNTDPGSLLATTEYLHPHAVLLSATMPTAAEELRATCDRMRRLGDQAPQVFFGGQAFQTNAELAQQVPGYHLDLNAIEAVQEIRRRIAA